MFDNIGSYPNNILIIQGDSDKIVPLSYSKKVAKSYKNSNLIIIEKEGHGFKSDALIYALDSSI